MDKKYRLLVLFALILVLCFVGVVSGETWYVDDDGGADYTRIQDAIDNATAGDTIIVRDGTYIENVDVYVDNLIISSVNGSDFTIVQAANSSDHVFEVTADYVAISGFTVTGADEWLSAGISLYSANNCNISNNNASNNFYGIELRDSSNNCISGNICRENNHTGIGLLHATENAIANNTCFNNRYNGMLLTESSNNKIESNTIENNVYGIQIFRRSDNIIKANICKNNRYGVYVSFSSTNTIYHNDLINNTDQAYDNSGTNVWDNGYPSGGNYWSDHTVCAEEPEDKRCGPDQDQACDGDGIWDMPYTWIGGDANGTDSYPLVKRCCPETIPPDKYLFIEKWRQWIVEVLEGDFGLCIDFPTYYYDASTSELYPYGPSKIVVNESLVGVYGSGTSLHVINGTGGGAASGLDGIYSLPFNDSYSGLTIVNITANGNANVRFGSMTRVLSPGEEWRTTESQVRRSEETGALINETFVTVITNFGLWEKSKFYIEVPSEEP
jgi:parallel beta-helix repeat protein